MSKAIGVFAMMALIIALIGMWLRFAPVTTEAVTAAEVQPLSNPISPFALTPENGQSLPDGYPGRLYARLSQSVSGVDAASPESLAMKITYQLVLR